MDKVSEATKSNYIQKMTPKYEEIMRRKLAGEKNTDIAKALKLSASRISFITTSPIFQERMAKERAAINNKFNEELALDPVKKRFTDVELEAADVIIEEMKENAKGEVRLKAANDVLAYGGHTKKTEEDKSVKILIDNKTYNHINIAIKALNISPELLGQIKEIEEKEVIEIGTDGKTGSSDSC